MIGEDQAHDANIYVQNLGLKQCKLNLAYWAVWKRDELVRVIAFSFPLDRQGFDHHQSTHWPLFSQHQHSVYYHQCTQSYTDPVDLRLQSTSVNWCVYIINVPGGGISLRQHTRSIYYRQISSHTPVRSHNDVPSNRRETAVCVIKKGAGGRADV